MLRDQRKQKKEREEEGDEFKDKEVFVTSAYRKQLEDANKVMIELNSIERIPGPYIHSKPIIIFTSILFLVLPSVEKPEASSKVQYIAKASSSSGERQKTVRELEREERDARMAKIHDILRRRNTAEDVEAARERFLERQRTGLIVI